MCVVNVHKRLHYPFPTGLATKDGFIQEESLFAQNYLASVT